MKLLFEPSLFIVLCVSLTLFWALPFRLRLPLLGGVSAGILAWIHPFFVVVMVSTVGLIHLLVDRPQPTRFARSGTVILFALLVLILGKYGPALYLSWVGEADWIAKFFIAPLGISYFVLRVIQYVFDRQRGTLPSQSIVDLFCFLFFFPLIPAGPIETYREFHGKRAKTFNADLFHSGVRRVLWGYFKKLLIAELFLGSAFDGFTGAVIASPESASLSQLFGYSALMFVKAYVDLSAYSDIAIGLSALFGFRIVENFNKPFLAHNIGEFWRRWHISLSAWCRDHIYFPVFGLTKIPALALVLSMLVMGLWHGVTLSWFLWGCYHGLGLTLVLVWRRFHSPRSWMKPVGVVVTFWFVAFGFTLVSAPTVTQGIEIFVRCYSSLFHFLT